MRITDVGETRLTSGVRTGCKAGVPNGHHLVDRSNDNSLSQGTGDRTLGCGGSYPDDDIALAMTDGRMTFMRKYGTTYRGRWQEHFGWARG